MRYLYALFLGLALGASSTFIYNLYPPYSLLFTLFSTCVGIWAAGRLWGKRIYRLIAVIAWGFVVLRAGFPGLNQEYLIQGDAIGISLINFGFIAVVIAIFMPL
jgi:hypothetical protein